MNTIDYSFLKYYPSIMDDDNSTVVGIAFYNRDGDYAGLSYRHDLPLLHDDIDMEMVYDLLEGIDIELHAAENFNLQEYTRHFVNNFRFTEIRTVDVDDMCSV